jgi:hypothetical protein
MPLDEFQNKADALGYFVHKTIRAVVLFILAGSRLSAYRLAYFVLRAEPTFLNRAGFQH